MIAAPLEAAPPAHSYLARMRMRFMINSFVFRHATSLAIVKTTTPQDPLARRARSAPSGASLPPGVVEPCVAAALSPLARRGCTELCGSRDKGQQGHAGKRKRRHGTRVRPLPPTQIGIKLGGHVASFAAAVLCA